MEIPIMLGFVLLLAGWFGMFFRVRRDHPGNPLSKYQNYLGPRLFGFKFGKSGFSLVHFYLKHYGPEGWFWIGAAGLALILYAVVPWSG